MTVTFGDVTAVAVFNGRPTMGPGSPELILTMAL